ncbi:Glyoxalase/bleomycin resistance protein/dioxygenase [Myxozyma melibiosi]|uniref:Glyoxalase/bleomycin resistance protein/dioxygenase n=1 Tax=Myxozyma melibiosi TaxID=54550 RepID=A0ABR1FCR4_9ASCO
MTLFDHYRLYVTDLKTARAFYDPILLLLGYKVTYEAEGTIVYHSNDTSVKDAFVVSTAKEGRVIAPQHISFAAPSVDVVKAFHTTALGLGAKDYGAPGPRPEYAPDYYAAFVTDFDGNNVEFTTHV